MTVVRGTPIQGLIGATLGFFIGFAAVSLFGPTVRFLETAAGYTPVLAALLVSIPNFSGSILRIPFSAMVETTGGRKPFAILLALSLIGVFGTWLVISGGAESAAARFPLLLLFGTLGGCGIATFSVGISQTSYWFPRARQGTALGIFAGVGNLAPGLFTWLLASVTIPAFGLAGSYLLWAVLLAIGLSVYLLLGRNSPFFQLQATGMSRDEAMRTAGERYGQELFPQRSIIESLKVSAGNRRTWALVFIYFTTMGGFMALTAWFPTYWSSYYGLGAAAAGTLAALYSIPTSLFRVLGGRISDGLGGERTLNGSLIITLAGALVLSFSASIPLSVAGVVLLAFGMGTANAAVFKLVPQEVPEAIGGAVGWVGGLGAFGGFILPLVFGTIAGSGGLGNPGYARGFLAAAALTAASLAVLTVMTRASRSRAAQRPGASPEPRAGRPSGTRPARRYGTEGGRNGD